MQRKKNDTKAQVRKEGEREMLQLIPRSGVLTVLFLCPLVGLKK